MISAVDQKTRHIQAYFENETGFVLRHIKGRCALSEMFSFELTLFHGNNTHHVDPADVIGLGVAIQVEMPE